MKTIIAIDPGASGGIAVRHPNGSCSAIKMPQTDLDIITALKIAAGLDAVVFMENIVKHMGECTPASTMAVYASNWGVIQGCVLTLGMRLELVTPQCWQKALGLGITGRQKAPSAPRGSTKAQKKEFREVHAEEIKRIATLNAQLKRDWKNKLKDTAQRLYPSLGVTLASADAILILEYGKRVSAGF